MGPGAPAGDDEPDDERPVDGYLTVRAGDAAYALPVLAVREIVRLPRAYPLPDVPPYLLGVVNLRGIVVPLLDLRVRLGHHAHSDDRTVVVVIDAAVDSKGDSCSGAARTGLVVDRVVDISTFPVETIQPYPASGGESRLFRGTAQWGDSDCFILDLPSLTSRPAPSASE